MPCSMCLTKGNPEKNCNNVSIYSVFFCLYTERRPIFQTKMQSVIALRRKFPSICIPVNVDDLQFMYDDASYSPAFKLKE